MAIKSNMVTQAVAFIIHYNSPKMSIVNSVMDVLYKAHAYCACICRRS